MSRRQKVADNVAPETDATPSTSTPTGFEDEYFPSQPPRRRSRRLRWGVAVLVGVVVLGAAGFLYARQAAGEEKTDAAAAAESEEAAETLIPVEVAEVTAGSVASYITATANLVPEQSVEVLAEAEGRIERILVEEGDRVAAGQVLLQLARADVEIALHKAQMRLANAELAFERAERMKSQDLLSGEDHDRLAMELGVARQELAQAQWSLSQRTVRAPFAGQITDRFVDVGKSVKPAERLFGLASYQPLVARIYLPEREVVGLAPGRAVTLALAADDQVRFAGRILRVSPLVDTATGTVRVTVEAVEKPAAVRPGGFVTVRIERERRDGVVVAPRSAVLRELQRAHVFVAADGVASKREVTLGMEEGERVEIIGGLAPGEQVITAGQGALKDQDKVKVLPAAEVAAFGGDRGSARRG
jgi:membrane fusion protein, multidrug efflux system